MRDFRKSIHIFVLPKQAFEFFRAVISTSYALYNLFLILVQTQKLLRYADATKYHKNGLYNKGIFVQCEI